jgi:hypothetical protein
MNRKFVAPALALLLPVAEVAHDEENRHDAADVKSLALSAKRYTLFSGPHRHADLDTEVRATTAAPISASGASQDAPHYVLHVVPRGSGFLLTGRPTPTFQVIGELYSLPSLQQPQYELAPGQPMYLVVPDIGELTAVLGRGLYISDPQMEAILKSAIKGVYQVVGGHGRGMVDRLYTRRQLERAGLTFRPPEGCA